MKGVITGIDKKTAQLKDEFERLIPDESISTQKAL
jgi:hypothetical protein